jgi:hypothetical protein
MYLYRLQMKWDYKQKYWPGKFSFTFTMRNVPPLPLVNVPPALFGSYFHKILKEVGQPLKASGTFLEHSLVMTPQEQDEHTREYRPHIVTISVTREGSVYNYWGRTHVICNLRPPAYSQLIFKLDVRTSTDTAKMCIKWLLRKLRTKDKLRGP